VIFSSVDFFVFLALLIGAIACLRTEDQRTSLLLASSYLFYAWWDWRFCSLLFASTAIDFYAARAIHRSRGPARRRWLVVSLTANLGILATFKYANFFLDALAATIPGATEWIPHLDIVLPIGISFFTFQSMSYTIDVYRRRLEPTSDLRDFALFVAFFPQLVAGPIVRAVEFLPQLTRTHPLRAENFRRGVPLFLQGFVKKVLFADTLALFVDPVFDTPDAFSSATCRLAAFAFTAQIYYDFSGYTDMAIGVGAALGFELPRNFRHPFLSRNVRDFWRRWHISLSTWMRDYVYIPLGGNRLGSARTGTNLLATMILGGLWHGASWTFVLWGAAHGAALLVHRAAARMRRQRLRTSAPMGVAAAWVTTLLWIVACFVVFRADSISLAVAMWTKIAGVHGDGIDWFHTPSLVILAVAVGWHAVIALRREREWSLDLRNPMHSAAALVVLLVVLLFAPVGANPFIYFQF